MKFSKIAGIAALMAMSSVHADDTSMSSVSMGLGSVRFGGDVDSSSTLHLKADGFSKVSDYGLAYGLGIDLVTLSSSNSTSSYKKNSNGNYTLGLQFKLGYSLYSLINYPVHIKVEAGYGVTRFNDENKYGAQFGTSLDVAVYKDYSVGIAYKQVSTGVSGSVYDIYTSNIVFIQKSI